VANPDTVMIQLLAEKYQALSAIVEARRGKERFYLESLGTLAF
jgi:hypothetical protein